MPNDPNDTTPDRLDQVLYELEPRLDSARRSYWRRRLAVLAIFPVMLVAGSAWAAAARDTEAEMTVGDSSEPGSLAYVDDELDGDAAQDEPEAAEETTSTDDGELADDARLVDDKSAADDTPPAERGELKLGPMGSITVVVTDAGIELDTVTLEPGWDHKVVASSTTEVVLYLANSTTAFTAHVFLDGGELAVKLADVSPDPTPRPEPTATPKPEPDPTPTATPVPVVEITPKPEPDPMPPSGESRVEIAVNDVGRVVVEREGDALWLGVLWHHEGAEVVVVTDHGHKVHAYFLFQGVKHHVKAWANEHGAIVHEVWTQHLPEPVLYDAVIETELGAYGVVVDNGLVTIQWVEPADGYTAEIVSSGTEHAQVAFTCPDGTWVVKSWDQNGSVAWKVIAQ